MTTPEDNYNNYLSSAIISYKNRITTFMDSYDIISNYTSEIVGIINQLLSKGKFKNDVYFHKSYISLLLPFESYITPNNGHLLGDSGNCEFTVADVEINGSYHRYFNKIIDYRSQILNSGIDLAIFDVLAAIIFEKILDDSNKHLVPEYKGCFLSYFKNENRNRYWDFNELKYSNSISPYNPSNIINNTSSYYTNESIIVMYEAVNNPMNVTQIFKKYHDNHITNKGFVIDVFNNCCDIYDFIKFLGVTYGFMHNDLHLGNVLYNPTTRKLVLIDFGRAVFKKFMDNPDDEINNRLKVDFEKLHYNEQLSTSIDDVTVENICNNDEIYLHCLSIIGNNDKYFGIIYDLITYSLNMYIRTLYFIKNEKPSDDYQNFKSNFDKIINIQFTAIENLLDNQINGMSTNQKLDELIDSYVEIKERYIQSITCTKTKRHFIMLLEGLFYAALYLHYKNFSRQDIYIYFQIISSDIQGFRDYVLTTVLGNSTYKSKLSTDSFLSIFIPVTGGISIISSMKSMEPIKSTRLSLFKGETSKINQIMNSLEKTSNAYDEFYKSSIGCKPPKKQKTVGGVNGRRRRILKNYKTI